MIDFGVLLAGLLAYAVSALLATLLVFVGFRISVYLTPHLDEEQLLLAGNHSVGIALGAVLLAQAVLLRHALFPIMVLLRGLFLEPFDAGRLVAVVGHCGALLVTVGVVSIGSVLMAAWLFARLTGPIPEMEEIAGDNLAVAIFFAFAVLAITLILDRGVEDLARSLLPAGGTGIVHVP